MAVIMCSLRPPVSLLVRGMHGRRMRGRQLIWVMSWVVTGMLIMAGRHDGRLSEVF
jgi:hypothetical protein